MARRSDRIVDSITRFSGSWVFVLGLAGSIVGWVLFMRGIDGYPFILLNLFISILCVFQAPFILMSQRRHEERDRARLKRILELLEKRDD